MMLSSSARRGVLRRLLQRRLSSSAAPRTAAAPSQDVHLALESFIARRESSRALDAFDKLQPAQQSDPELLQRLALLVASAGSRTRPARGADAVRLADAAGGRGGRLHAAGGHLHAGRVSAAAAAGGRAVAVQSDARADVLVDLPAVDALLRALVGAHRVDEAVEILKSTTSQHDVRPTEQTFQPVLVAIMQQQRYEDVTALIEHGRVNEVDFSPEVRRVQYY